MVGRVSAGRPLCLPSSFLRCLFFPREGVLISGAKVPISEKSWRLSHLQRQKSVSQTFIHASICAKNLPRHSRGICGSGGLFPSASRVRRRACECTKWCLFSFCLLLCIGSEQIRRVTLALRADWTLLGLKARR